MNNLEKIKNIEFLRVIGCIAIILFHFFNGHGFYELYGTIWNYGQLYWNTLNGNKAVDLFFILSGLFFTLKLAPPPNLPSMYDFVKKKVLRLWPVLIWSMFLSLLISLTGAFRFSFFNNILTLLGLNGTGLVFKHGNVGVFWYVSAMLWVLILFYYLLKNFDKKIVNLIIALLIYFSYAFILNARNGSIGNHVQTFYYIFNIGILRALGGIGIGYFIGEWYKNNKEKIKNLTLSLKTTLIITALELCCLYFIIYNLMLHKLRYNNQIIFIIVFATIIVLFLLNKGYISKALNNDFSVFLGKYTYSIYMTHTLIKEVFKNLIWKYYLTFGIAHPVLTIIIALSSVLIIGVFTYHCVEKPAAEYIKQKIK